MRKAPSRRRIRSDSPVTIPGIWNNPLLLVDPIREARIRELQAACERVKQARREALKRGDPPRLVQRRGGEAARTRETDQWAAQDRLVRFPPLAEAIEQSIDLVKRIIEVLLQAWPAMPRSVLLALIRQCWPSSSGPRPTPLFDPALVRRAHDGYMQVTKYDCKTACQWLADPLGTSARTIENYRRPRRRSSPKN